MLKRIILKAVFGQLFLLMVNEGGVFAVTFIFKK